MSETIRLKSVKDTESFAKAFAKKLKPGDVVALNGTLAAGKTTLVQFLAKELGVEEYVNSPTFTIVNEYKGTSLKINHMDFYRLNHASELIEIGFEDYLNHSDITLIEWAERFPDVLPKPIYKINISLCADGNREMELTYA